MKKRIPLFFYIDLLSLDGSKQDEVVKWFREVSKNNYMCESDSVSFSTINEYGGRYIGFINTKGSVESYLGARQSYDECDFSPYDSVLVSYNFWKKYIKNKEYTVVTYKENSDGTCSGYSTYYIYTIDKDTVTTKKMKRNQFTVSYLKNSLVSKALKESGKKLDTQGVFIDKKYAQSYNYAGTSLLNSSESVTTGRSSIKKCFIKSAVSKKILFKCQYSKCYAPLDSRRVFIMEDGSTLNASNLHVRNTPRSNRYDIIFFSRVAATNYGYASCEVTNDWLPRGEARKTPNARYKALARTWACKSNTQTTIGFEIEKEDEEAYIIGYDELYEKTKWCKENDSSVDGPGGYELVTPVYDLFSKDFEKDINKNEDLQKLINAKYSDSCGGHINISSKTYSPAQLVQGFRGFLPLLYSIWSLRITNRYCPVDKPHNYSSKGKYSALHVKGDVLEFRLASAVKSVKNLIWRRDLIRIMMENINRSELEVLRMLLNKHSKLHKHMRKVYSPKRFEKKCDDFVRFTERFNDVKLKNIDWDAVEASKYDTQPTIEED
jgi:translation initiation factor 2 beta subunit (eIF-2beta)/eIF-5